MGRTTLVTGGASYIGSHTGVELLSAGHDVVVVDNFVNRSPRAVDVIRALSGRSVELAAVDVNDRQALNAVFRRHDIEAVLHFAAYKAVGESVARPSHYCRTNVGGLMTLVDVMEASRVPQLVFSIYGGPSRLPITESFPLGARNPYECTKLTCEDILRDVATAGRSGMSACCVTSIPWAPIPPASSVRIPGGFPATGCPTACRSRWAVGSTSPYSATTTRPATVLAFAIHPRGRCGDGSRRRSG